MYLNKAIIMGNLTRDPELKALPSGSSVVNLSVATNRSWKESDGTKKEAVEYHNCVAFGKTAEIISQYFKKGQEIYLEGRLQTRSWEVDGVKKYTTEVIVDTFQFGSKPSGESAPPQSTDTGTPVAEEVNAEDIPF